MLIYTRPDCQFCTGTHHMLDQAEMGPCICANAENLTACEAAYEDVSERFNAQSEAYGNTVKDHGEALASINAISDHFTSYLVRLGVSRNATLRDPDLEAIIQLLSAFE